MEDLLDVRKSAMEEEAPVHPTPANDCSDDDALDAAISVLSEIIHTFKPPSILSPSSSSAPAPAPQLTHPDAGEYLDALHYPRYDDHVRALRATATPKRQPSFSSRRPSSSSPCSAPPSKSSPSSSPPPRLSLSKQRSLHQLSIGLPSSPSQNISAAASPSAPSSLFHPHSPVACPSTSHLSSSALLSSLHKHRRDMAASYLGETTRPAEKSTRRFSDTRKPPEGETYWTGSKTLKVTNSS